MWRQHRHVELLESRRVLNAFGFGFAEHSASILESPLAAADIDHDGITDLISATHWSKGTPNGFGETQAFDHVGRLASQAGTGLLAKGHVVAARVNDDDRLDLITAGWNPHTQDYEVAWFEQIAPRGSFGPRNLIFRDADLAGISVASVEANGTADILVQICDPQCHVEWRVNDGNGAFRSVSAGPASEWSFSGTPLPFDYDNDGDTDFYFGDRLWLNVKRNGELVEQAFTFAGNPDPRPYLLYLGDLDNDQTLDAIAHGPGHEFAQYSISPTSHEFVRRHGFPVADSPVGESLVVADFGNDGYDDILITYDDFQIYQTYWLKRTGTTTSFQSIANVRESHELHRLLAVDVNGDAALDLVSQTQVRRFEPSRGRFAEAQAVARNTGIVRAIGDLNHDGFLDQIRITSITDCVIPIGPCSATFAWVPFDHTSRTFAAIPTTIHVRSSLEEPHIDQLHVVDIDGDGDHDIAFVQRYAPSLYWLENKDGRGSFDSSAHEIALNGSSLAAILDVDGDNRIDLLLLRDRQLVARRGTSTGIATQETSLADDVEVNQPSAIDWDGDGDADVVGSRVIDGEPTLVWHERVDDENAFGSARPIVRHTPFETFQFADFDNDGDRDVVLVRAGTLIENRNRGTIEHSLDGFLAMDVGDLDADGDIDIVAFRRPGTYVLLVNDGSNAFTMVPAPEFAQFMADIDGDSDGDILTYDGVFYEQRPIGDANGDGRFTSADLVLIMLSGHYEDTIAGNSTFTDGDWNGDGDFDSRDLMFALRFGLYEP